MRISDAERAEVSDRLSQHYSDGRLDEAEFGKRLDQAMHAVTQSDLDGLFDDLPDGAAGRGPGRRAGGPPGPGQPRARPARSVPRRARRRRTPASRVAQLAVLIVVAVIVGHALSHLFMPLDPHRGGGRSSGCAAARGGTATPARVAPEA